MKSILEGKNIEKYYGNKDNVTRAIDNISFKVEKGEFVGIMGPSGSGKTTLLNCISTIDKVTTGSIEIDGADITRLKNRKLEDFRRDKLGFIFQDFNLLDTLTAFENISLALTIAGKRGKEVEKLVKKAAESLEIESVLNKYPYQMSGGQKQRVAIAGVVAMEPKCIVFDEPTAMLDPNGRKEVIATAHELNKKKGVTILLITHYMEEVVAADYVYVMEKGKIIMDGTPREIFSRVSELKEHRLDVPQVTLLADELRKSGVDIPAGILTREELVDAVMNVK